MENIEAWETGRSEKTFPLIPFFEKPAMDVVVIQDADITGRLEIGLEIIFQERKKGYDFHSNYLY
jgi:hypothetical protein